MDKHQVASQLLRLAKELADSDYVPFGDVARKRLDMQAQYASRYLDGRHGSPKLGEGIRFRQADPGDYHTITIHKDDVEKFVEAVKDYQKERGM